MIRRGEVYRVSLDPTEGHEQQGTRPVLVVSSDDFNRITRTAVIVPITGGGNLARTAGYAVSLMGVGIQTDGAVRCDQVRTLDLNARNARRIERVPEVIIDDVLAKLSTLFES